VFAEEACGEYMVLVSGGGSKGTRAVLQRLWDGVDQVETFIETAR